MRITGEDLYKIWCAWPIREDTAEFEPIEDGRFEALDWE